MRTYAELLAGQCTHQEHGLNDHEVSHYLSILAGWSLHEGKICQTFSFENYYETIAFVNAIAYEIHAQNHHPELIVTYNRCSVKFNTHSVNAGQGGISENDFICAAKIHAIHHSHPQHAQHSLA